MAEMVRGWSGTRERNIQTMVLFSGAAADADARSEVQVIDEHA